MNTNETINIKEILQKLKLRNDFFERNPATLYYSRGRLIIGFERWKLQLTREEFETLQNYISWLCGACCGFGGVHRREEGEYVVLEGIPCMCHDSWSFSAEIPL
jgi:hypothetical protein